MLRIFFVKNKNSEGNFLAVRETRNSEFLFPSVVRVSALTGISGKPVLKTVLPFFHPRIFFLLVLDYWCYQPGQDRCGHGPRHHHHHHHEQIPYCAVPAKPRSANSELTSTLPPQCPKTWKKESSCMGDICAHKAKVIEKEKDCNNKDYKLTSTTAQPTYGSS